MTYLELPHDPTMIQVVIAELNKIPEKVIELSAGNFTPKELIEQSIGEAIQVIERFMDITYQETDLVPPEGHTGPDVQLCRITYTERVEHLAQQYWDSVNS